MSLYFSAAVWASLALCVAHAFESHLPRYRTEVTTANAAVSKDRQHLSHLPVEMISSIKR
jgi:hypothetical protein